MHTHIEHFPYPAQVREKVCCRHMYATTSGSVQKGTASDWAIEHSVRVKKKELSPQKLFHVPCPTCGATAGGRCELHLLRAQNRT